MGRGDILGLDAEAGHPLCVRGGRQGPQRGLDQAREPCRIPSNTARRSMTRDGASAGQCSLAMYNSHLKVAPKHGPPTTTRGPLLRRARAVRLFRGHHRLLLRRRLLRLGLVLAPRRLVRVARGRARTALLAHRQRSTGARLRAVHAHAGGHARPLMARTMAMALLLRSCSACALRSSALLPSASSAAPPPAAGAGAHSVLAERHRFRLTRCTTTTPWPKAPSAPERANTMPPPLLRVKGALSRPPAR